MPKLENTTNMFASFERICPILKEKGSNLTSKAVATAVMESVLLDANDAFFGSKDEKKGSNPIDWLMLDGQKELRIKIRDAIMPCITAAKNYQNSYLEPSGLMPKVVGSMDKSEFV